MARRLDTESSAFGTAHSGEIMLTQPGRGSTPALTPGRIGQTASQTVSYPSPFFDIAQTYLPPTVKSMFRWVRYYYLTSPLHSAIINKMALYPLTDMVYDTDSKGLKDLWQACLEDDLQIRSILTDIGIHYFCYGNAPISMYTPTVKWLGCSECHHWEPAKTANYRFYDYRFRLTCRKCGALSTAEVREQTLRTTSGMKVILWNPEDLDIHYNALTHVSTHYFNLPTSSKNEITLGRRETVEDAPQIFLDAAKQNKSIVINRENIYHLKRAAIMTGPRDRGWGIPLAMPVLKDTFYLQIMKKSQESVLLERLLPLVTIYPQQSSEGASPYSMVNLTDWRKAVRNELFLWRQDRQYIPILPLPIGHQVIGGDGRALLLTQEMRALSEQIISGMGVPQEFFFGGLSYSGSSVSLRMLENQFLRYLSGLQQLLNTFIIRRIAAHMDWPAVKVRFKPFKMADDLQRKAYLFQLNQAGKISDTTLLQDSDLSPEEEDALLKSETKRRLEAVKQQQLAEAEIAGEAQVVNARYQAKAQTVIAQEQQQAMAGMHGAAPGEPGEGVGSPPVTPQQPAEGFEQVVQRMRALDPQAQQRILQRIGQSNPQLAGQIGKGLGLTFNSPAAARELPVQLPPRRGAANAQI